MKIKQVEELVGITKKNIRFYEEQGLLQIERAENGYREYHQKDVIRLQEIKLLRKIDISIEEMRALFEQKESLQICLEQHLKELEHRKRSLGKMQEICERMIQEHLSLDTLDAEACLEEVEKMEKEGVKFMDVNRTDVHRKKNDRCDCRCSCDDCAYGMQYASGNMGKCTGSDSVGIACAVSGSSGCNRDRNTGSTCRKNERDRRRRRR